MHNHILPGLDDGPVDMDGSLELAQAMVDAGFSKVVATPHCDQGGPTVALIKQRLKELQRELVKRQIPLQVAAGAEYVLAPCLPQRFAQGQLQTLHETNFLLLECPAIQPLPPNTRELIFELRLRGCHPVLAHPERCSVFQKDLNQLYELVTGGVMTQITLASLTGALGPDAEKLSRLIFASGLVHILATDAHSSSGRFNVTAKAMALADKLGGPGTARLMLQERPASLLENRLPPLPEPQELQKAALKWKRRKKRNLLQ